MKKEARNFCPIIFRIKEVINHDRFSSLKNPWAKEIALTVTYKEESMKVIKHTL